MTEWFQFNLSGFFFRINNGRLIQGASMIVNENGLEGFGMVSARPGQAYFDNRPELFHRPMSIYLEVLDRIPLELVGNEDYSWALSIVAE